VTYAVRGSEQAAMLMAFAGASDEFVRGAEDQARESGFPSRHAVWGGTPVFITDNPDTGAHVVMAVRGCVGYTVASTQPRIAEGIMRGLLR
jgi:hypothetical protein